MEQTNRVSRLLGLVLSVFGFLVLVGQGVYAQVDTGAILGTVKDQSGAVVPGAKVALTNEGTSFSISKETGADGSYIFTPIKIGTYRVEAEFQAFQKAVHPHVTVDVQQQVVVDFELVPGAITQVVEVAAAPPLLQTQSGSVGHVVASKTINDLPLNGRNYTFLAQLTAGVNIGQQEGRGLNATGTFAANGTRPAQSNYLLDGIDNNNNTVDFLNGASYLVRPPVDAIAEFKLQTNGYSAEIGRAGGAVLNAAVKSGTNDFHGTAWEFLRNDQLDAADFFENAGNKQKGTFRQNQFGFAVGGPVWIPRVYNGRNKTFWFFDYEGTRIRQASPQVTTVPTAAQRASGYTDFSDLIAGQSGSRTDVLGRTFPLGTIFDPATTRGPFGAGQIEPLTRLTYPASCTNPSGKPTCFVRDPFPGNIIPQGRLNPNAIKLLNLYPAPSGTGLFNNFTAGRKIRDNINTFDVRVDHNFSEADQIFARVSYFDEPRFKPGPFDGLADGGNFNQGIEINTARNAALSYTHSFSATTINEARFGYSGSHSSRLQPFADTLGIPDQFGIKGIPQLPENGGLPIIAISGLNQIGAVAFLPSERFSSTYQITENLTKVYRSHTFKGGFEYQRLTFPWFAPAFPRGQFNFDGAYTSVPNQIDGSTGRAQLLFTPARATVPNGIDNVGGAGSVSASNFTGPDDGRPYYAGYFQDDWKVKPKLTLNLGLRWEFFGQTHENFGAQANMIPGPPFGGAKYLMTPRRANDPVSQSFLDTLAKEGIQIEVSTVDGLVNSQTTNFGPRFGFAYQVRPKLVVRGGYGIFYGGFENRGGAPDLGENYPFLFDFSFPRPDDTHPVTYPNGSIATLENGLSAVPLDPRFVNATGLQLRGIQFDYITPRIQGYNLMLQYQLTPNQSLEIGYVGSLGRHIETFTQTNGITKIAPPGTNPQPFVAFPDFSRGVSYATPQANSYYHALQTKFEKRFSMGLNFLTAYTYSKTRTDAHDLLSGGGDAGFRAPSLPGFGIERDYGLANFDIRNVFHFSGGYELPLGRGKRFLSSSSGLVNAVAGGWSMNWIVTLQDGQPQTIGCSVGGAAGLGCYALLVPGQDRIGGRHDVNQYYNPAAFTNPLPATTIGQTDFAPLGGAATQVVGPGFHRLDSSLFKQFKTSEKTHLEFRAEFFNLTNHPNFALPGFLNFTDAKNFSKITATRDNPNDPRQIQFALKFYW